MQSSLIIMAAAVGVFTMTALILDLRTRRLPNWLTVSAFVLALLFHIATDGFAGLGTAMGGFAIGFGLLLVLWMIGGGGGGDVKLMGALGAWLGAPLILIVFVLSAVLALLGMIGVYTWKFVTGSSMPRSTADNQRSEECSTNHGRDLGKARQLIPYAVPVAIASWAVIILKLIASSVES